MRGVCERGVRDLCVRAGCVRAGKTISVGCTQAH